MFYFCSWTEVRVFQKRCSITARYTTLQSLSYWIISGQTTRLWWSWRNPLRHVTYWIMWACAGHWMRKKPERYLSRYDLQVKCTAFWFEFIDRRMRHLLYSNRQSINQSINQPTHPSIHPSIHPPLIINQSIHQSLFFSLPSIPRSPLSTLSPLLLFFKPRTSLTKTSRKEKWII